MEFEEKIMFKIEYGIKLNEYNRPYIDLPTTYEHNPEDKFFALEISRYILKGACERLSINFDETTKNKLNNCLGILEQVSDEVAKILWDNMKNMGDIDIIMKKRLHINVGTIENRNELLNKEYVFYEGKIYTIQEGLRVFVFEGEGNVFELQGGITNECWVKIE